MDKTIILVSLFVLFLWAFLTYQCGRQAKYEDISYEEEYSHFIGKKYRTTKNLLVHGITLDKNYKKQIDVFTIDEPPGFSGPEIISKGHLPEGTLIQIRKVVECINCLPKLKELEIDILSEEKYSNHPVRIEEPAFKIENKKIIMNPKLFEQVTEK